MSLPFETRLLLAALAHGGGRRYDRRITGDFETDCSRMLYGTLCGLYGGRVEAEKAALHIEGRPIQPWSPVEATVRLGFGSAVAAPMPGRWHVVQGWRAGGEVDVPWSGGHSFLWRHPASGGPGVQVQANEGVGAFVEAAQTWEQQTAAYKAGVRLAVLDGA